MNPAREYVLGDPRGYLLTFIKLKNKLHVFQRFVRNAFELTRTINSILYNLQMRCTNPLDFNQTYMVNRRVGVWSVSSLHIIQLVRSILGISMRARARVRARSDHTTLTG